MKKPMLSAEQIVNKLDAEKGIKFELISKEDAIKYLNVHNNYLRTASYRINYDKVIDDDGNEKYSNLDFAYLVELSRLDLYLRRYLLRMSIDVEHSLKQELLRMMEQESNEYCYDIVDEFLDKNKYVLENIKRKQHGAFTGELIEKHFKLENYNFTNVDCPIWALVELISFGDLVKLYVMYCENRGIPKNKCIKESDLKLTAALRNACAHNNCILRDLHSYDDTHPTQKVSHYVSRGNSSVDTRKKMLSVRVILEMAALFYCYDLLVSPESKLDFEKDFKDFANSRLVKNIDYFENNDMVRSRLLFIKECVDILN